ncbi:MAG: hypothetical protein ACTSU5_03915 [Promethearchaeota archaeon]
MASGKKTAVKVVVLSIITAALLGTSMWMYVEFQVNCPFPGIPYANMLAFVPLVFAVVFVFKIFGVIRSYVKERNLGRPKKGWTVNTGIFAVIFIFAWAPFVLPAFDHGKNTKHFSVYNDTWSGCSKFKQYLITDGGFDEDNVRAVQASLSSLTRLNGSHNVLLVMGPNKFYNPLSEIPFFWQFFRDNGSILICHDHGSTQYLLLESALVSGGATPFALFANGVLMDNESYYKQNDFPVITTLDPSHPITKGLSQIVLSRAGGIVDPSFMNVKFRITGEGFDAIDVDPNDQSLNDGVEDDLMRNSSYFAALGFTTLGQSSYSYSWIDVDGDGEYDPDKDVYKIPSQLVDIINQKMTEAVNAAAEKAIEDILNENTPPGEERVTLEDYNLTMDDFDIDFQFEMRDNISLGGYPQVVFAAKDTAAGTGRNGTRTVFCTDASLFNNELIDMYDNKEFAIRTVQWLARGDPSARIVFDELHLDPEVAGGYRMRGFTSVEFFGMIIGYVNWLSTNPFLSWIYPFLAIYSLRKWLPKSKRQLKKEKAKLEKSRAKEREEQELEFRTKSFFARKITWYRENKKYREALTLLYRRVQRQINAHLQDRDFTVQNVVKLVRNRLRPDIPAKDLSRLKTFLNRMEKVRKRRGERITDDEEFKDLFYEMIWASEFFEKR